MLSYGMSETVNEAVKTMAMFMVFAMFYVPVIVAYMNGAVDAMIDKFVPDPDAPNFVKYGEAVDA
jgi:hypothetical protein